MTEDADAIDVPKPDDPELFEFLKAIGLFACGLVASILVDTAAGQAPAPRTAPGDPTRTPPEKIMPKPSPTMPVPEAPPGTLSDELSKKKGVITPPKTVDPDMHKAPPADGKMRVIPPPGSPGGPSDVQPK